MTGVSTRESETVGGKANNSAVKAKGLQTQLVDMMMGEALSRGQEWRKIGLLRYRAAKVQTKWALHLAFLRKQHQKSKAEKNRNEEDKDGSGKTDSQKPVGKGDKQASVKDVDEDGDEDEYDSEYDSEDDSDESETDVTMADVRGEMKPFISDEMD